MNGYGYRIIKSSIIDDEEPPAFNHFGDMFIDGIKVLIVNLGYAIPVFVIIIVFCLLVFSSSTAILQNNMSIIHTLGWVGIVLAYISIAYILIITPIFAMALVHMADNNDQLSAAFRFREILAKIANLG